MSDRLRLLSGLLTLAVLAFVGATLLADGRQLLAAIVAVLFLVRGALWVRQLSWAWAGDDDDDDDER